MDKKNKIIDILGSITEYSIYILIFCLSFSKSIIEICITVAFCSWLLKKLLTKDLRLKRTPLDRFLLVFLIFSSLSLITTPDKALVLKALFSKCLKYIALYFIVVETIDSQVKLKNLIKVTFASAAIVMVDSYIQYYFTHFDLIRHYPSFKYVTYSAGYGFPTGPFPFPNDLSGWMLIILMTALSFFIWDAGSGFLRLILAAFLGPFVYLFYLANTRSAWLGFFIAFFITLVVQNKKFIIVAVLLIAILSLPFLPKQKAADIFGLSSMQDRAFMWRTGWKIFMQHPVIGNGLNTFFGEFRKFREDDYRGLRGSYAHNGYLQIAADTGILGLSAFLLLLGAAFFNVLGYIRRSKDKFYKIFALGLGAGLLAFLIHSLFDTNLQSLPLATLFWFSLAVLMALTGIKRHYGE